MSAIRRLLPSLAFAAAAMLATAPVQAYPVTLALENATFTDGGTASGVITLNSYGNIDTYSVTTTPGSPVTPGFAGVTYFNGTPIGGVSGGGTIIALFANTYAESMGLFFASNVTVDGPAVSLNLASSYECVGFSCTGASIRTFASGDVEIPEPLTMTIFGAGLIGLAAARRRG